MNKDERSSQSFCEKVSHHELQAARAEQERKILQEEFWRQQQDFREVHRQNLTEMKSVSNKLVLTFLKVLHPGAHT